jgi:hypothetical protein
MDVILHVGAHRTATTTFQTYLRQNRDVLAGTGIGFWGPWRTRNGLLSGVADRPAKASDAKRARGRVQLALHAAGQRGVTRLVVSDENMLGSTRQSLRAGRLYPAAGERIARVSEGFGRVHRIVLSVRSLDAWWASSMAFLIPRGQPLPSEARIAQIAESPRTWRHLVTDLACACPQAEIVVVPFECYADNPGAQLALMTGLRHPPATRPGAIWKNRHLDLPDLRRIVAERGEDPALLPEGSGRWQPFSTEQALRLREAYADDLFWLEAGADGLATYKQDLNTTRQTTRHGAARPGDNLAGALQERGHGHDRSDQRPARRLARDR